MGHFRHLPPPKLNRKGPLVYMITEKRSRQRDQKLISLIHVSVLQQLLLVESTSTNYKNQTNPSKEMDQQEQQPEDITITKGNLPTIIIPTHRCQAVAKTTKKQCKKKPVEGKDLCHVHLKMAPTRVTPPTTTMGGTDDRQPCQAVCTSTGLPCRQRVSRRDQSHCPIHGGLTKEGQRRKHNQPRKQPIPWAQVHGVVVDFLLNRHPQDHCRILQPCNAMAAVRWLQQLSVLHEHCSNCTKAQLLRWQQAASSETRQATLDLLGHSQWLEQRMGNVGGNGGDGDGGDAMGQGPGGGVAGGVMMGHGVGNDNNEIGHHAPPLPAGAEREDDDGDGDGEDGAHEEGDGDGEDEGEDREDEGDGEDGGDREGDEGEWEDREEHGPAKRKRGDRNEDEE